MIIIPLPPLDEKYHKKKGGEGEGERGRGGEGV